MFIIIIKAIIGWLFFMVIGTNIIGFIIRNLHQPPINEYINNQYVEFKLSHQNRSNLFIAILFIIIALVYFFLLYYFWNVGVTISAAIVMFSRVPDLLHEIKTGMKIKLTSMPRKPLDYLMMSIQWAALPLLWYSLYIQK